ncbi:MAG TPA: DUF2184 domain-containing protein [Candidatus Binatia bacterium]|nr:DUF2184 domain-containing protein [Candidatus Binatia bacterium]
MQTAVAEFSSGRIYRGKFVGRRRTHDDLMTFDRVLGTMDNKGNQLGVRLLHACQTHDGKTVDSTGAFLVGELERLDMTLHEPLAAVTWGRDIDLREDVTIADEVSSFTLSTYGSAGGLGTGNSIGNGKAWIGKDTSQITGIDVDISKTPQPLRPWGMELKYTILELESAARLGRPIDQQKYMAMQLKYQMDVDEQVYIGDTALGDTGLVNSGLVTPLNVVTGASGFTTWAQKSPDEILADVNSALSTNWQNAAWAVLPTRILIPPAQYGYIATAKVSLAGNESILQYILRNNLCATARGAKLEIYPVKWAIGAGVGGTIGTIGHDRMIVYVKEKDRIRFPMTPIQRTPVQYDGIYHKSTYFGRLGVMEVVYPETVGYYDGI